MGSIATAIVHGNIDLDQSDHFASIINVERYLTNSKTDEIAPEVLERALSFAKRDAEWLLYPMDPMQGGRGFSARFSLNDHLDLAAWVKRVVKLGSP